jgi:hypothetical protein
VQRVEHHGDVVGTAQLTTVRRQQQSGPVRDPEGPLELRGRPASLVVGEPEADHAAAGVLGREPRQRARVQRVAGAVGSDHHRHPEPGLARRDRDGVQDQVGEGGDAAEPRAVARRVDLDLEPAPAVAHVVLGRLPDEPVDITLRTQHGARHVVEPLEAEPALLVGR